MSKQKSLSIVAFVGLTGSGKTTATDYLAHHHGAPRIRSQEDKEIIDELHHLAEAGQRLIVLDDLASWEQCLAIKHAFPGRLSLIALTAQATTRHRRLLKRPSEPLSIHQAEEQDNAILEASQKAEPIAAAEYTIVNEGSLEKLHEDIDSIVVQIRTCTSQVHC